jgi:hypothetical protein
MTVDWEVSRVGLSCIWQEKEKIYYW